MTWPSGPMTFRCAPNLWANGEWQPFLGSPSGGVYVSVLGELNAPMRHGSLSVTTSAIQLSDVPVILHHGVRVKAAQSNGNRAYVGTAGVTNNNPGLPATDGYELRPGDEVFLTVDDLSKVWIIARAGTQSVFYIGS